MGPNPARMIRQDRPMVEVTFDVDLLHSLLNEDGVSRWNE